MLLSEGQIQFFDPFSVKIAELAVLISIWVCLFVFVPEELKRKAFFLQLLIILLTARIFAELATYLRSPPVIGELLAGVILGPSLFGLIQPVEAIRLMAGIGIILLLFQVGLETDIRRLVNTGLK